MVFYQQAGAERRKKGTTFDASFFSASISLEENHFGKPETKVPFKFLNGGRGKPATITFMHCTF